MVTHVILCVWHLEEFCSYKLGNFVKNGFQILQYALSVVTSEGDFWTHMIFKSRQFPNGWLLKPVSRHGTLILPDRAVFTKVDISIILKQAQDY